MGLLLDGELRRVLENVFQLTALTFLLQHVSNWACLSADETRDHYFKL